MDLRRFSSTTELEVSGRREKQWGSQHPLIKMQQTKTGRAGFLSLLRQKLFVYLQRKTNIFDVMAKNRNRRAVMRFVEKHYSQKFLNFLGVDILRDYINESNLAIAEAQRYCTEVREKGLWTMGVLSTIAIALCVALYSIKDISLFAGVLIVCLSLIIAYAMYKIFKGIIKKKISYYGGNTLTNMLPQIVIDRLLETNGDEEKNCQHLYLMLDRKEEMFLQINAEIKRMQGCYTKTTSQSMIAFAILIIAYLLAFLLFLREADLAELKFFSLEDWRSLLCWVFACS